MMRDKNPLLVQRAPFDKLAELPPVILIHDGGGTTFGYFSLDNLNREVWAIHNPNYFTAEPWKGGMEEMARHYIHLIEKAGFKGRVLLGGWSLGGYLSVLMARILADSLFSKFSVAGLLIIDSPYHIPWSQLPETNQELDMTGMPELVQKSFDNCDEMLDKWELPSWGDSVAAGKPLRVCSMRQSYTLDETQVLHKPIDGPPRVIETSRARSRDSASSSPSSILSSSSYLEPVAPPPAVLVRCIKETPTKGPAEDIPYHLDWFRDDPLLGWADNYPPFIKAVFDTNSHHFDVFDLRKVNEVTENLKSGLEILDNMVPVDVFK